MDKQISLSVIVPVYNEEENIAGLFQEIKAVCETGMNGVPFDYEITIINDGSTDKTDQVCRSLWPVTYIQFRKNFGQTSAMDCGFKAATKEFIAALDGDGQNDPADIPMMLQYLLDNNYDVVSGWRRSRHDTAGKRFISRGANILRHMSIHDGIHDSYRKECFDNLTLYGEQHRFIPALLKIRGFKIGEVEVHHRPRVNGKSKYSFIRVFKGFLDMLSVWFWSKYASRPLHLLGGMSLFFFFFGAIFGLWTVIGYLITGHMPYFIIQLILAVFFLITGQLLLTFGLLGEMMMKTYFNTQNSLPYHVKEIVKIESEQAAENEKSDHSGNTE